MWKFCLSVLAFLASSIAHADEAAIALKNAPGHDTLMNNCAACHSLDYIQMNSPFPDRKMWEAEVTKMIKTYGAPIGDEDARTIIDYLSKNYSSAGPT